MTDYQSIETPTFKNIVEPVVGAYTGQVKWFNDKLGFGFITVTSTGPRLGKDHFVHYSGIVPKNSKYLTLKKGEYVNFNIVDGAKGQQAVHITGVGGGSLMCDIVCQGQAARATGNAAAAIGSYAAVAAAHLQQQPLTQHQNFNNNYKSKFHVNANPNWVRQPMQPQPMQPMPPLCNCNHSKC